MCNRHTLEFKIHALFDNVACAYTFSFRTEVHVEGTFRLKVHSD